MADANIRAVITADDRASKAISNFGSKVGRTAKRAGIAIAAAGAAAVAFGVSAVKSFSESQDAIAQLNAVLKSTKGVAGVTSKAAINLASSMQKVTKFSDEEILSAESLILTFTKINKKIFPDTVKIVADMSTALGQDLKSSSIQVGKALQDPILGVTALRRVGVNFSTAQRDVIKNLVETGNSAKAQAIILKELQVEFGGSARAAGETFAGKLAILKNQFDEVKESIGKVIVEALAPLFASLANFVASDRFQAWLQRATQWLKEFLPRAITFMSNEVIPVLVAAFNTVWPVVRTVLRWVGDLIRFLANNKWVIEAAIGAFIGLKIALGVRGVLGAIQNLTKFLRNPTTFGIWGTIAAAGVAAAVLIIRNWKKVKSTLINVFNSIVDVWNATVGKLFGQAARLGGEIKNVGAGISAPKDMGKAKGSASVGARQMGGPVLSRKPYIVGEQGPELFIPQSSGRVIANNRIRQGGGGSVINLHVNIGMYAGSEVEKRKMAKAIMDAFQDYASSKNMTASQLLS